MTNIFKCQPSHCTKKALIGNIRWAFIFPITYASVQVSHFLHLGNTHESQIKRINQRGHFLYIHTLLFLSMQMT